MSAIDDQSEHAAKLRQLAEQKLRQSGSQFLENSAAKSPEEIARVFHELQVHQIELEIQNEELRRAQEELVSSRARYFDLYDFAPVGYCTVSGHGMVTEINLTASKMLGEARSQILNRALHQYVIHEDQDLYYRFRSHLLDDNEPHVCELRMIAHDKSTFWVRLEGTTVMVDEGKPVYRMALSDITEHKMVELALHESDSRFRNLLQDVQSVAVQGYTPDGIVMYWNRASELLYGYTAEEAIGRNLLDLIIPHELQHDVVCDLRQIARTGTVPAASELSLLHKDGSRVTVFSSFAIVRIPGREPEIFCIDMDLTEHKRFDDMQNFLARTGSGKLDGSFFDDLVSYLAESLNVEYVCVERLEADRERVRTVAVWFDGNREADAIYALEDTPSGQVVGKMVCSFPANVRHFFPEDKLLAELKAESYVGVTLWSHSGQPMGVISVSSRRQMTNRKQVEDVLKLVGVRTAGEMERLETEQRLRASESKFRSFVENANDIIFASETTGLFTYVSPNWTSQLGHEISDVVGHSFSEFVHPDDVAAAYHYIEMVLAANTTVKSIEYRVKHLDGSWHWHASTCSPIADESGKGICLLGIARDITLRKQREEELRRSELNLNLALSSAHMGVWHWDIVNNLRQFDDQVCALLGLNPAEFAGTAAEFIAVVHPDDHALLAEARTQAVEHDVPYEPEYRAVWPDGSVHHICARGRVVRDAAGCPVRLSGIIWDITNRKQAEEDKALLEAELQQAMKMDSVGRLAGGVAHDFNNMLGVILGNTQLLLEAVEPTSPLHEELIEIQNAAERSADLTRKLLSFARKQTVAPKVLDLNDTVTSMLRMLQRLIGEGIALQWQPKPGLWPIKMDPSQIDQMLANLCVNARDAIDGVGTITIQTSHVSFDEEFCAAHADYMLGSFVRLDFSDSGCGIDSDLLPHIFEPFFTTKGVGEGSGLGLSSVYGAIKQNNGFITAYSELGQGTTFSIYIPRYVDNAGKVLEEREPTTTIPGHETILLVEDEPAILRMTRVMLERLGYTVITASTPSEATHLAERQHGDINLLLTDVVMPEMNGRDLAQSMLALYPHMGRLFMSGYTSDVIAQQGKLEDGVFFIQKPFSMRELSTMVRQALDWKR